MTRKVFLPRILAAIVVIAAFAVPSPASAHEGHVHHAPGVEKAVPASAQTQSHHQAAVVQAAVVQAVASAATLSAARAADSGATGNAADCAGHCCGGAAGMTCCGAALAPDPFCVPLLRASVRLVAPRVLPSSGLPPEALPKPPKSFA